MCLPPGNSTVKVQGKSSIWFSNDRSFSEVNQRVKNLMHVFYRNLATIALLVEKRLEQWQNSRLRR